MVNEIKLDNIGPQYKVDKNSVPNKLPKGEKAHDAVSVTNHLTDLIKTVNSYEDPISHAALSDIKYRIQNNDYQVDYDRLSDKLLGSGIITITGD